MKVIKLILAVMVCVSCFYVGMNCGKAQQMKVDNDSVVENQVIPKDMIPVDDIAAVTIDEYGYWQLEIKDLKYVNDDIENMTYKDLAKEVNSQIPEEYKSLYPNLYQ